MPTLRLALSLILLLPLGGCATTTAATAVRIALPLVDEVIRRPAKRPLIRRGEPAKILATRALIWGDENGKRLLEARDTYERLRQRIGPR